MTTYCDPGCVRRHVHQYVHQLPPVGVVPRRAAFDDLRVDQWVAWCDEEQAFAGYVRRVDRQVGEADVSSWETSARFGVITRAACVSGYVTILADASTQEQP